MPLGCGVPLITLGSGVSLLPLGRGVSLIPLGRGVALIPLGRGVALISLGFRLLPPLRGGLGRIGAHEVPAPDLSARVQALTLVSPQLGLSIIIPTPEVLT